MAGIVVYLRYYQAEANLLDQEGMEPGWAS